MPKQLSAETRLARANNMLAKLKIYELKPVVVKELEVSTIRVYSCSVTPKLNELECNACLKQIGDARPISSVWAGNRSWRLCHDCTVALGVDG